MNACPSQKLKTRPRWPNGLLGWWNILAVFLLVFLFLNPPPALAATGINKQINFQGKVVNANGTNVANGNYDFVFSIYTVATAGTAIWTETRTTVNQVAVTDGIFRVSLGSITALPGSIDFNTDNIYLGINFNNDGEMTPRVQFTAVPQAFNALKVAGLTVTDTTGTFTLAAAKTLTVNNTLTFAGTDATSFTFPSTTGGTVLTSNAPSQTITSTQTSGTVLGISDSTAITAATIGQSISLSGTGAFDQTGLKITLSGATGTNLNALVVNDGTNDTALLSKSGVLTLGKSAATSGQLKFKDSTTSFTTTFAPSTAATADVTYTLPTAGPGVNGYVLTSQTNGTLSWTANGAGGGCATCLQQVPALDADNTIAPTADVLGLLVKQTTNVTPTKDIFAVSNSGATTKYIQVSSAGAVTLQSAASQALNLTGNGASTFNFGANTLGITASTLTLTADTTIAANKNLTLTTGTGTITQGFSSGVAATGETKTVTNTNAGATATTVNGLGLNLVGTTNANANANTIVGITFGNVTAIANNAFNGINFGTGFNNFLTSGTVNISAAGAITGATYNGLTVNTTTGTLAVTNAKTLTVSDSTTLGTNAITLAGGEVITFSATNALSLLTTGATSVTLPTSGTLVSSVTTGNGVSATNTAGALAFTLGAITPTTVNGLTFVAAATGFTAAGGTTSKTLTVSDSTTLGTNSITLAGGEVITFSATNAVTFTTSGTTSLTLPTSGTLLTNTASSNQTVTSTQTSGTVFGISDSTAITAAIVGQSITLSGTGAFDQTGLQFNLSGASGTNLNDILGSGSTWKVSRAGVGTFASGTVLGSQTFTTNNIVDSGALTIKSGGTSALTLDTSGATAINIGNVNATSIALGNATTNPTLTLTGSGLTTLGGGLTFSGTTARTITGPNTGAANALTITTAGNISGLTLNTAAGSSGNSGAITIQTGGTSVSGTSGTVTIDVGAGVTANGSITIGGTNASSLSIGRAGVTTTNNGTLTSTGLITASAGVSLAASQSYTGAGAVTLSSGGASGLTFDSASSDITVAANDGLTFASGTGTENVTLTAGTGGTTAGLLVKVDSVASQVVTTGLTDTNNAIGVAVTTTTAGSAARIAIQGVVSAIADNTVAIGDYIGIGSITAGRAKSLGATYPTTANLQVLGRAMSAAVAGGSFNLMLSALENSVSAGAACSTCVSFATGTPDNTTGTNNLIHLQKSGTNRFVVANTGGLTINGTDSSVVRTLTSEFATGTVGSNLTNANDQLELSDGTIPNAGKGTITTATQPTTSAAVSAGALAMTRADGKYFVLLGSTATSMYDSVAGTFTAGTALGTAIGVGAQALPRPDGRYLIIHGSAGATRTIIDPIQVVANTAEAGANFCASSGAGAVSFKRADGKFLVVCGNGLATTAIYDPIANSWAVGPSFTVGTQSTGGLVLNRPDGQALVINGGATATTQLYNPNSGTANIGVFAAGPTLGVGCEINGAGSVAFRRQDGKFVVLSKLNASTIYDPVANTFTCRTANGPGTALGDGAHAISLQNGKLLVLVGGASTNSYIYDSSADTFTLHGTATTAISTGAHSIMRHDGTWQILVGGSVTTTNNYDTGLPMTGTTTKYTSDDISTTSLNTSSTLKWTAQYESPYIGRSAATNTAFSTIQFFVRTAVNSAGCTTPLNAAVDREILSPGDLIRPGSTDNCIRLTVQFNRPLPKRVFDERGTWTGNGSTVHRLDYATPTLFDIAVDNSTVLRRTNFDFTNPNAGSAAPQNETSGPTLTRAEGTRVEAISGHLTLPYGRLLPTTQVGTTGFYQGLTSGAHPALAQAQTNDGTIVIARPNKTFIVIASLTTPAANAALYDPASQTFTAQSGSGIPTAANGPGGFAIKRPDGKFLVVLGNSTTTTNIYDPDANTFAAGPALSVAAGVGAMAILNGDSTYTIVHGAGATTSSIYNPVRNTMMVGPTLTTAANCGAWAIPMGQPHNNQHKMFVGAAAASAAVTTTMNYDANSKVFTAGTALTTAHGCGSFAFQRQDGWWVTIVGASAGAASTATNIMNPNNGITIAGPVLSAAAGRGTHVIPRADGTFLILHAGATATTTTTVYFPWGGTFGVGAGIGTMATGPALQTAAGTGALSFQRPDGKWVIVLGNATATTNLYDAGWYPDGQYLSEQVNVPALAANSTLEWKQAPDNYVRMEIRSAASQAALGTTGYYSVGRPGQSIANAGGETWVQVEVNFRRDFPTFPGTLDGVYPTGGGMVYSYRNISLPTVYEYKLNNGMDLLNLQDNGFNVLRVTSNGGIYSSQSGGFFAGGADLAENYTSSENLEKGEVVVADGPKSVKRSGGQYQRDILGVVSTAPGFVAGAHTEDSYPIALVGRVPVKVSTENGPIKAGDFLTSSSIPGYGMKATLAGRVLGKALEDFDAQKVSPCVPVGMGVLPNVKCGEVMMFVNLTDYLGSPVELVMAENSQESGVKSLEDEDNLQILRFAQNDKGRKEDQILAFLKELKEERENNGLKSTSEVFTDRVSAVNEIITPHVITELLTAKKIKADSIEGLEILTDKISARQTASLSPEIASMSAIPKSDAIVTLGNITIEKAEVKLDLTVLGKIETQGGLIVGGPAQFKNDTVFASLASFISKVIFKGTVFFEGVPTFNSDTAGFAVIKKDTDQVEVTFDKEYAATPIVSVNMTFDPVKLADGSIEDSKVLQKRVAEANYSYFIINRNTRGFAIVLNKKALENIPFSWTALSVKDAKRFESAVPVSISPTPSPSPSITPSVTPIATSSAGLSP